MKSPRPTTRLARASHGQMGGISSLRPGQGLTSAGMDSQPPCAVKALVRRTLFAIAEMKHGRDARAWGIWWRFDQLAFHILPMKGN